MRKYKIYVDGYEVGTIEATPEQIKKYNENGITVKAA